MPNKIKIILAEDEPALALIIKESLETRSFEVVHCKDGEEALKLSPIKNQTYWFWM